MHSECDFREIIPNPTNASFVPTCLQVYVVSFAFFLSFEFVSKKVTCLSGSEYRYPIPWMLMTSFETGTNFRGGQLDP